jgi:Rps23 Pro-64 3,4-dihydroxylase Tpa1-like proline 4-hydroxylase
MAIATDIINKIPSHGVIRSWLGSEAVTRLLRFVQSNERRFEDTKVTRQEGEGSVDRTRRVSRKLLSIDELEKELCPKLEGSLPVIFHKLGNKPFIPSRIEVELVAHGDGAFFARHDDTFTGPDQKGRGSRAISAVYYFHALPKAFSGGILRLHSLAASGKQGTFADIAPDRDTLVFFPSFFPHEVLTVKCSSGRFLDCRFAVNFWLYQK